MERFVPRNILVIGDVMLDIYYIGHVSRISPEAPVPVFLKEEEKTVLGGAANVAANLMGAGQKISVMSVRGRDAHGDALEQMLQERGVDTSLILKMDRRTTTKTRFLANHSQQVFRLDVEDTDEISEETGAKLLALLEDRLPQTDIIVISDYMKGLLPTAFVQGVIDRANARGVKVVIDIKDRRIEKYRNAYLLKPNLAELRAVTGMPARTDEEIASAAEFLRARCACCYVLTTLGARGMLLVGEGDEYWLSARDKEVFDVTGAGDTSVAYLAVAIANGYDIHKAMRIANVAAGIQVTKIGTSQVTFEEIEQEMSEVEAGRWKGSKAVTAVEAAARLRSSPNKRVVFTNGCFDILHAGHVRYLKEAAELGDLLIVGVNSDASVRRLKGKSRPINAQQDRVDVLSALACVDMVIIFDEDTPYELIRALKPDVLVKGGDYRPDQVVGRDIVEAKGGKLVLIPLVEGKSTTAIIHKAAKQEEK